MAAGYTASALVISHDELGVDWFSDEMWRANLVHSPRWWQLYLSWDTPTPPGFVLAYRALDRLVPTGPQTLRLTTLAALVAGLLLISRLLFAIIDLPGHHDSPPPPNRRSAQRIGAVAACLLAPLLSAFGVHRTFVPYLIELCFGAALLLGCVLLDSDRRAWPWLMVMVVAAPLFTIAPLFLFPAVAVVVARWAWREPATRRCRLTGSAAGFTISGAVALVVYWVAYRPVAKDSISSYWADTSLVHRPGAVGELLGRSIRLFRDGLTIWAHPSIGERWHTATLMLCLACLATGLWSLGRQWPPLLGVLLSGWTAIILASVVAGWPMTPERVNLAVVGIAWIVTLYGGLRVAAVIVRDRPLLLVGACVLATVAVWPSAKLPLFGNAFLRGLTPDLNVVADSPALDNVVITYHFASRWYAEDALVTRRPGGRHYTLTSETYDDTTMYDPAVLAALIARAKPGTAIWCVIPYDIGPDAAERACRVPTTLIPLVETRGERSLIRGFLVP